MEQHHFRNRSTKTIIIISEAFRMGWEDIMKEFQRSGSCISKETGVFQYPMARHNIWGSGSRRTVYHKEGRPRHLSL